MEIMETLWKDSHRLVAVNLVGADLLGRRLYGLMDPIHFQIDPERFQSLGMVLVEYYRFMDDFVGRIRARIGNEGVIILVSDHGMGPAPPVDPKRRLFSGRPHPAGLVLIWGSGVRVGQSNERLMPYHLTPLILNLLGQPLPQDGKQNINDRILSADRFEIQTSPAVPTYEDGKPNPSPSVSFGKFIGDQERYTRFGELAPPMAR
jgi:hypothetical protein